MLSGVRLTAFMLSENRTDTVAFVPTPVAPSAGLITVTKGAVLSEASPVLNVKLLPVNKGLPETLLMLVPTTTLIALLGEKGTLGVNVTTLSGPPTPEERLLVPDRAVPDVIEKVVGVTVVGSKLSENETTIEALIPTLLCPTPGDTKRAVG
ncbi:MAG TPA: hypothetical protein VI382_05665 [Candidatus Manganitrophaceae bacterium]|nr:hypothetical protein [Candidatus Manganitrophaceae bacterium]